MITSTFREAFFFNVVKSNNKGERIKDFFKILKDVMEDKIEIRLPMQLMEITFDFDFHRGAKHPISSNIVGLFKENGFKVSKVRNSYLVRIRPHG